LCLGLNMAAALLSLGLAAAVVIDALLLPSVLSAVAVLCLGSNMAAALLSLGLADADVIDALLLPSVLSEAALLSLGLVAAVVIDAPPLASVLSAVAVLCLGLTAAVVTVSSPGAQAPARPAAGVCLGPAAGASFGELVLLCALGEEAGPLGVATSVDALLPRACLARAMPM